MERFPERFRFQLTKEEMAELVANCDRFNSLKHSTVRSYAFTANWWKESTKGNTLIRIAERSRLWIVFRTFE